MDFLRRHIFDLVCSPLLIWLQLALAGRVRGLVAPRWHGLVRLGGIASACLVGGAVLMSLPWANRWIPFSPPLEWLKAGGLAWGIATAGAWAVDLIWRKMMEAFPPPPQHNAGRRRLLQAGHGAALAVPAVMLGYGCFIERHHFRLVESRILIPGLHRDLHGLRLAQLTDMHFGTFFSPRDLRYAIDMANAAKPHLALVTGDLISVYRDPLDECIDILRGLRAEAGVLGCLGNHEIVADCEDYAELLGAEAGIRFLRDKAQVVRFGQAELNVAGVDYQRMGQLYLRGAGRLIRKDAVNVLLSHNPDVFPVAGRQGWDLTVAGHTHGGQITVEILGMSANVARFYTPYVYGHYKKDGRQIYVSRGLGTVGIPSRLGAPPEVSLLTLCAT